MVPPLVDDYRVVIPDLPGHWKSDPKSGPLGIDQVLAGLEAVMETTCAGEPAILVGNSMGAWISMLYAVEHPDRVERLVAINGGAIREDNPQVNLFPTTRDEAHETMKALMGPATPPVPDFVLDDVIRHARVGPAGRLAQTADAMDAFLLDGRLGEVDGAGGAGVGRCRRSPDPGLRPASARRSAAGAAAHGPRLRSRAAPRVPGQDPRGASDRAGSGPGGGDGAG